MTWVVEFCAEDDGGAPVEDFLAKLPREHRAKALALVRRLEEAGPTLPFPYSSQVKGKLRELRTQYGKDRIRILYFADKQRHFILLHAFMKRTEKLPVADIEIAERRMKQHEMRGGSGARQRRRAMGVKSHPTGNPYYFRVLEDPQFEILGEKGKGIPKWLRIRGQFREVEVECWHEIEERKGIKRINLVCPKSVSYGWKFGKATFELSLVERGFRMEGRIDCGPLEMIFYPDFPDFLQPVEAAVSQLEHKCERREAGCIKEEFLGMMGLKITPLM